MSQHVCLVSQPSRSTPTLGTPVPNLAVTVRCVLQAAPLCQARDVPVGEDPSGGPQGHHGGQARQPEEEVVPDGKSGALWQVSN